MSVVCVHFTHELDIMSVNEQHRNDTHWCWKKSKKKWGRVRGRETSWMKIHYVYISMVRSKYAWYIHACLEHLPLNERWKWQRDIQIPHSERKKTANDKVFRSFHECSVGRKGNNFKFNSFVVFNNNDAIFWGFFHRRWVRVCLQCTARNENEFTMWWNYTIAEKTYAHTHTHNRKVREVYKTRQWHMYTRHWHTQNRPKYWNWSDTIRREGT